jgi:hypothetical protein
MNGTLRMGLDDEIEKSIKNLSNLKDGSEERRDAIKNLETLYKLHLEDIKLSIDNVDKCEKRSIEEEHNKRILKEQIKDRYGKIGLVILEVGLPLLFYAGWLKMGFKFEETGTFTSGTFRGFWNRLKP